MIFISEHAKRMLPNRGEMPLRIALCKEIPCDLILSALGPLRAFRDQESFVKSDVPMFTGILPDEPEKSSHF